MSEAAHTGGQNAPWCASDWPDWTIGLHLPRPSGNPGLTAMRQVYRQCSESPPHQSIGTYLATALILRRKILGPPWRLRCKQTQSC